VGIQSNSSLSSVIGADELHNLLFAYFHVFTQLADDHVVVPQAADVT